MNGQGMSPTKVVVWKERVSLVALGSAVFGLLVAIAHVSEAAAYAIGIAALVGVLVRLFTLDR